MILTILKIRAIQIVRLFQEIGLLRAIVLIAFLAFGSFMIFQTIKQSENSVAVSIITGLIILSIHASRKDKRFLKMYFNRSYLIFLVEYFMLVVPILIAFCIFSDWRNLIVLCLVCLLIPRIYMNLGLGNLSAASKILLYPFSSNFSFKLNIKTPFTNPRAFEWISGFRHYFIFIIPVYLIFLGFSFKEYVGAVSIIILSIIVSGFYYYGESREFIALFSQNYRTFLVQKMKLSLTYLLVLLGPIILVSILFQPGTWYFILGTLIIASLIQIITIIFKYALFAENTDLGRNGLIISINVLCILLPFLWPLPIVMGIRYYLKAQNNLKKILNGIN